MFSFIRAQTFFEKVLLITVGGLLAYLLFAVYAIPVDFDSVGYRLSRIGLWLQNG